MAKAVFDYNKINNIILSPLQKQLVAVGLKMEGDMKRSMKRGTGRIYLTGKNRNIEHQASSPGSPPAVDIGRLKASISTNWTESGMTRGKVDSSADAVEGVGNPRGSTLKAKGRFKVVVGTNVVYGPWLEFGTRRMAARPFVRPIFDRYKPTISRLLAEGGLRRG